MDQLGTERQLINRCKQDPSAFGSIYDQYFDAIFNYCLRRVADPADAEDLTAQTFAKSLAGLRFFRWRGISISAWLYRIATNEINSFLRKSGRYHSIEGKDLNLCSASGPQDELEALEQEMLDHRLFMVLHHAIRELKTKDQTLLSLRFFENKPFSEISEILGVRQGTLIMRCRRALTKLKKVLEKKGVQYAGFGTMSLANPQTALGAQNLSR